MGVSDRFRAGDPEQKETVGSQLSIPDSTVIPQPDHGDIWGSDPPHPRQLALLSYQGPISLPLLGSRIAGRMIRWSLQSGRGREPLQAADLALFAEHIPAEVTVAMYRTFLTHELVPIARGRYDDAVLKVPTTLLTGERDLVTKGSASGPVAGQPQLHVEVLDGVTHWVPELRPGNIIDWVDGG